MPLGHGLCYDRGMSESANTFPIGTRVAVEMGVDPATGAELDDREGVVESPYQSTPQGEYVVVSFDGMPSFVAASLIRRAPDVGEE